MALTDAEMIRIRIALQNAEKFAADARKARREIDRIGDSSRKASKKTDRFGSSLNLVQRTARLVKLTGLIASIGFLAQAASAGAAGLVALAAAASQAAGGIVAYPAVMLAGAQALGVFKLATLGVMDAVGGLHDKMDQKKLAKLVAPARSFARVLQGLKAPIIDLQRVAARGFFPGATEGLKSARPLFHTLRPLVDQTARAMGTLAQEAGRMFGGSAWRTGIGKIGRTNVAIIRHLGSAGLHLSTAFMRILVAARPMVTWITRGVRSFAGLLNVMTSNGEKSGALTRFFHDSQVALSRLARLGKAFGGALFNIIRAGKPLGDELLVSLLRTTQAFEKWTGSAKGQNAIRRYFQQAKPAIYEIARLIRDATKEFLKFSQSKDLANLIKQVRTKLLPALTHIVDKMTAAFGPAAISTISSLAKAITPLTADGGALTIYLWFVQHLADAFSALAAVPGFTHLVTGIVAITIAVNATTTAVGAMTAAWASATAALAVFRSGQASVLVGLMIMRVRMAAVAAATRATAAAQWAMNAAMTANPIGLVVAALAALAAGLYLAYTRVEWFHNAVDNAWSFIKAHWPLLGGIMIYPIKFAIEQSIKRFGGMVDFVKGLPKKIGNAAKGMFQGIIDAANSVINRVLERLRHLVNTVKSIPGKITGAVTSIPGKLFSGVKDAFAGGGVARSTGPYLVGERGPEIVTLRAGQEVIPNHRIRMSAPSFTAPSVEMKGPNGAASRGDARPIVIHSHNHIRAVVELEGRQIAEVVDHQVGQTIARA